MLKIALYALCFVVLANTLYQLHEALKAEEQRITWQERV
jgi:hypothetical protein